MAWLVSAGPFLRKVLSAREESKWFQLGKEGSRDPPQSHKHGRGLMTSTWDKRTTSWLVSQQRRAPKRNNPPQTGSETDRSHSCRMLKTWPRLRGERLVEAQNFRFSLPFPNRPLILYCIAQNQPLGSPLFVLYL